MAKSRWTGAPRLWPAWPRYFPMPGTSGTPFLDDIAIAAASAARIVAIGHIDWADGGTHDASIIHFRIRSAASVNFTLRVSLRDPDAANGPPGRDDGTADQSATQVNPAANTNYSLTLGANRTLAQGELVALVFDYSAYTAGSCAVAGIEGLGGTSMGHRPLSTRFDGTSTWVVDNSFPGVTVEASDGTIGIFSGALPRLSAAVTTLTFNSGTGGADEYAMEFTVAEPLWAGLAGFLVSPAASADFDIVLYDGTTALKTISFVTDTLFGDAQLRLVEANFGDVALESGKTYRLAIKPTTANSISIVALDVTTASHLEAFAGTMKTTSRVDSGAWAAPTATRILCGYLGLVASDNGAGGGGGGGHTLNRVRLGR